MFFIMIHVESTSAYRSLPLTEDSPSLIDFECVHSTQMLMAENIIQILQQYEYLVKKAQNVHVCAYKRACELSARSPDISKGYNKNKNFF